MKRRKRRCQQRRKIPKRSKTLGGDQQEQGSISAIGKFNFVAGCKGVVKRIFIQIPFLKLVLFVFFIFNYTIRECVLNSGFVGLDCKWSLNVSTHFQSTSCTI